MDIAFGFDGQPVGGEVLNYLLEKSRVTYQNPNECNFHVFYFLLFGAADEKLKELGSCVGNCTICCETGFSLRYFEYHPGFRKLNGKFTSERHLFMRPIAS